MKDEDEAMTIMKQGMHPEILSYGALQAECPFWFLSRAYMDDNPEPAATGLVLPPQFAVVAHNGDAAIRCDIVSPSTTGWATLMTMPCGDRMREQDLQPSDIRLMFITRQVKDQAGFMGLQCFAIVPAELETDDFDILVSGLGAEVTDHAQLQHAVGMFATIIAYFGLLRNQNVEPIGLYSPSTTVPAVPSSTDHLH